MPFQEGGDNGPWIVVGLETVAPGVPGGAGGQVRQPEGATVTALMINSLKLPQHRDLEPDHDGGRRRDSARNLKNFGNLVASLRLAGLQDNGAAGATDGSHSDAQKAVNDVAACFPHRSEAVSKVKYSHEGHANTGKAGPV